MSDQTFDRFTLPGDIPDRCDSAPSREREGSETCRDPDLVRGGAGRSRVGSEGSPEDRPTPDPSRSSPLSRGQVSGDYGVPTQDWLARGLRHPAGRGWEAEPAASSALSGDAGMAGEGGSTGARLSDAALNARLAEYGVALRPDPGSKPWPGGWLPGDPPLLIDTGDTDDAADPYAASRVFDTERRVRFLDALATCGEVRAAAARVGVSRETCYRARRRDPDFKRLWDAALVHARAQAEAELATRALHGIEVPVFVRGEHVATWRRHDARLLLAHLGRLDRRVEEDHAAAARAERFDELLAALAGHAPPEDLAQELAEAVRARDPYAMAAEADLPPTREECLAHTRDRALAAFAEPDDHWGGPWDDDAGEDHADALDPAEEEELRAEEERHAARCDAAATAETAARYDEWLAQGFAHLDTILAGSEGPSGPAPLDAACGAAQDRPPPGGGPGPQAAGAPPEDTPAPHDHAAGDRRLRGGSRCGKRARKRKAARARAARRAAAASPPDAGQPLEYKSLELGLAGAGFAGALDRVAGVNGAAVAATARLAACAGPGEAGRDCSRERRRAAFPLPLPRVSASPPAC